MKPVTPSQTIGPFWHPLAEPAFADLRRQLTGATITLTGLVTDGAGAPITDACIELWQPPGWGRCATGPRGEYAFTTVRPAAGHAAVAVLARGLVKPLWTRVYFVDDPHAAPSDALLAALPPARRRTLLARLDGDAWRFDIRLQGDADTETVFLAL